MVEAVKVRVFESIESRGEQIVLQEDCDDVTRELGGGVCFIDEILERLWA